MLEWLVQTCEYFATRPDLQLLDPRAPGGDQRLPAVAAADPRASCASGSRALAPNIIVVPPESGMSTYALMSLCNAAIIYGTKMGVELTSVGLPVIVAGEAWIRNKGLTHDASSPEEYFRILEQLPFAGAAWTGSQLARARRYAYHFFFNRMIPLPFIEPKAGYPIYRLKLDRLQQLLPGASAGPRYDLRRHPRRQPFVLRASERTPELAGAASG